MPANKPLSATVTPDQWLVARRLTALPLDRPGLLTLEPGVQLFGPVDLAGDYLQFSVGDVALSCRLDDFLSAIDILAVTKTLP
jgi:hypothetical protein